VRPLVELVGRVDRIIMQGVTMRFEATDRTSVCSATTLIILAALLQGPARAGTVYWNASTASPTSSTDIPGTITVGDVSRGNNNGVTPLTDSVSASSGYTFLLNGTSTSASGGNNFAAAAYLGSLSTGSSTYFEFTITPSAGSFPLESISFGSRSTNTGPLSWTLRSSDDNYATDLVTPGTLVNDSTWAYASAPLTTVFIGSAATTFRIYGYNGTGTPSVNFANWRIDDVQAIVVPEPATLTAAAALSIGLWLRRRQRAA